jgi:hypothetical protein
LVRRKRAIVLLNERGIEPQLRRERPALPPRRPAPASARQVTNGPDQSGPWP